MTGALFAHAGWGAPPLFLPMFFFFFAGLVLIRMALKDSGSGPRPPSSSAFLARRTHPLAHVRPALASSHSRKRTSTSRRTRKTPHRRSGPRRLTSV